MKHQPYLAIFLAASLAASSHAFAQSAPITLVELFTSEGCSSCPPADTLLGKIHLTKGSSGELIVGLSEHVTYWNRLGWKDPFSQELFSDRQTVYADRLSAGGPYTPQMVVNGRRQFVGSDQTALTQALRDEANRKHTGLEILEATHEGDALRLRFSVTGASARPLNIVAVLTDENGQSRVLRGENAGRSLQHVSVARLMTQVATVTGNGEQSVRLPLSQSLRQPHAAQRLILFAQEQHQGEIVGAATKPL